MFFRGDFRGPDAPKYSRGVRQKLRHLAQLHGWAEKYKIFIGDGTEVPGEYSELLASSVFCLHASGNTLGRLPVLHVSIAMATRV